MKYLNIEELRKQGYLQEVNRNFFHPLGLAMEISINDEGGEYISGIWDCRNDKEGIYYDIENSDEERKDRFRKNKKHIDTEMDSRIRKRIEILGFGIEPID